jgi:hypothetical protein
MNPSKKINVYFKELSLSFFMLEEEKSPNSRGCLDLDEEEFKHFKDLQSLYIKEAKDLEKQWKESIDFQRYLAEHKEFLSYIKENHPDKDLGTRIFWNLSKLKARYPLIAEAMKNFKQDWYDQRRLIISEEFNHEDI